MSDYKKTLKAESEKFLKENHGAFLEDDGEHGGKSGAPNFSLWLDRTQKLTEVVEATLSKWSSKEFQWVQVNTRNPSPGGGDPRSRAFGSYYSDLLHEIKKLKKKSS